MRSALSLLFPLTLLAFAACSSSESSDSSPKDDKKTNEPGDDDDSTGKKKEPPLVAHDVCATVAAEKLGDGCSGTVSNTGSGDKVCVLEDAGSTQCGGDLCLYQRIGSSYDFLCAPSCKVGGSTKCPLGYECVAPNSDCSVDVDDGVCAQSKGFVCEEIAGVTSGTLLEGPKGELLRFSPTSNDSSTLSIKNKTKFTTLATVDEGSTYGTLTTARSADGLLIVLGTTDILFKDGKAKTFEREPIAGNFVYSSDDDGTFVRLEASGSLTQLSYASLAKRSADGKWSDVGPTKQKIADVHPLNSGFVARCAKTLCVSRDGETFDAIELPDDVDLSETSNGTTYPLVTAGASADDFYVAVDGELLHYRKGKWVTEGPKAGPRDEADASTSSYSYSDRLHISAGGTVVYETYDASKHEYSTYVSGDACWGFAPGTNLDHATLTTDGFVYFSVDGSLCSRPTRSK